MAENFHRKKVEKNLREASSGNVRPIIFIIFYNREHVGTERKLYKNIENFKKNPSREIFGNFGNFSDFRNSEIREFSGNFPEIPEILENPGNRPWKIDRFGGVYKRLQPENMKKPLNFPPEIPGKSPTFSENFRKFRKIPEVVPGKSSILEMNTRDYSRKTRKNNRIFPPKSRGNLRNPGNLGNPRHPGKFWKVTNFF